MTWSNHGAAANRRPAGQSDGSFQSRYIGIAADRAFPAAVAELGSLGISNPNLEFLCIRDYSEKAAVR
jgi:hypothetical protein